MKKRRVLAFYLPQFHPIPENDIWWQKGFTEWTNVAKARPLNKKHYQPHVPADLGFYDLRLPEARIAQAELAANYGISGFVYYHYWFSGRRILERPISEVLISKKPDFPFCVCWVNESWTRIWDGGDKHILINQTYSVDDDIAHIRHLIQYFEDDRYIRVDGKPLFLVYRTEHLPNPRATAERWRNEARRAGVGELYLARVESFESNCDPASIGFDAAVEFAPDWRSFPHKTKNIWYRAVANLGLISKDRQYHRWCDYDDMVARMLNKPMVGYRRYRCVTPGFDNTPRYHIGARGSVNPIRRKSGATIIQGSTPETYGAWLKAVLKMEQALGYPVDQQLVFVNAWNEWGEGNHLEPDQKWGRAYLEQTLKALGPSGVDVHA